MKKLLLTTALAAAIALPAMTAEAKSPIEQGGIGAGMQPCSQITADEKIITKDILAFSWAQGWMTGLNLSLHERKLPMKNLSALPIGSESASPFGSEFMIIDDYCRQHPEKKYYDAVLDLFERLPDQQQTKEGADSSNSSNEGSNAAANDQQSDAPTAQDTRESTSQLKEMIERTLKEQKMAPADGGNERSAVKAADSSTKPQRAWLGVEIQPITADIADAMGFKSTTGALVANSTPNGPAAKSGIKSGDVIISLNGTPIADPRELASTIGKMAPGKTVMVGLNRDGRTLTISVTLGAPPSTGPRSAAVVLGAPPPTDPRAPIRPIPPEGYGMEAVANVFLNAFMGGVGYIIGNQEDINHDVIIAPPPSVSIKIAPRNWTRTEKADLDHALVIEPDHDDPCVFRAARMIKVPIPAQPGMVHWQGDGNPIASIDFGKLTDEFSSGPASSAVAPNSPPGFIVPSSMNLIVRGIDGAVCRGNGLTECSSDLVVIGQEWHIEATLRSLRFIFANVCRPGAVPPAALPPR